MSPSIRSLMIRLAGALLGFMAATVSAQSPVAVKKFYAVLDLQQSGVGPVLIGGRPAKSTDFPASFYSVAADGNCTSTMVSARVLLTAAHCVANGGKVQLVAGGAQFEGVCTHAPDYAANETADWAMCLLTSEMSGVPFERVNTEPARLALGAELLLTGFGCTKPGGGGGNDGTYRIGEAVVFRLPSGDSNDIVTMGDAALCFGDSGGPAFLYTDSQKRARVVVSVNSRGNIKNTSYLSSVTTAPATTFLTSWADSMKVRVCGLHADAKSCRVTN